jgi:hypothetical protein
MMNQLNNLMYAKFGLTPSRIAVDHNGFLGWKS